MPLVLEEIDIEGDAIYILFESAGEKYLAGTDGKGRSTFTDRTDPYFIKKVDISISFLDKLKPCDKNFIVYVYCSAGFKRVPLGLFM